MQRHWFGQRIWPFFFYAGLAVADSLRADRRFAGLLKRMAL